MTDSPTTPTDRSAAAVADGGSAITDFGIDTTSLSTGEAVRRLLPPGPRR